MVEAGNEHFMARARTRQEGLTKPRGSLGRLEELAVRLCGIQRSDRPTTRDRAILIFAADHGVSAESVSPYPAEVTGQMVANFVAGGAAVNAIAGVAEAKVVVVDVGILHPVDVAGDLAAFHSRSVRKGTRNLLREPAMTHDELDAAMHVGATEVAALEGVAVVGLGEMGIGNTTAASAIASVLTGLPPEQVTGRGTGLDDTGLSHKVDVIERALAEHGVSEPKAVLRHVGGLEIAALVGCCLEAARRGLVILVDGFITTAAFAVARRMQPAIMENAVFAHRSSEPGHRALLEMMDVEPLLDLGMRLGEGTGAALAIPILDAAVAAHNGMASFESAGVTDRKA